MATETNKFKTTSIRPKALRRAQVIATQIGKGGEYIVDYISAAVDDRSKREVARRNITLPKELAFDTAE